MDAQRGKRMTLRILIVSNVRVVREGLNSVLTRQEGVDVVGTIDLLHAKDHCAQLRPEVILFDAGRQDAVELVKDLVSAAPHSKVVAFGVRETEEDILALAAAGTAGYIRDNVKSGDVVGVLRQLLSDELLCSPRAAASLFRHVGELSQRSNGPLSNNGGVDVANTELALTPLSRRELQIAYLIDRGLTNKEIGRQLGIEAATVKNHIHNICEKLNVHRRGEATARIRAMLSGQTPSSASAPESFPTPKRARDQNPAARNHVGQPWAAGQLGGIATASAPSDAKRPIVKF
jgi:two-component system, NarL family, nitrate/nitrite response regulator NarL